MLNRLFPKQFDNTYRGHWFATWLFVPAVLMKLAMGVNSVINTRFVATAADAIPVDSYGGGGAETVIAIFSFWGLCTVLFAMQGVVALIRYRAMIPFMYLVLLIEHVGRKLLALVHPIAHSVAHGAVAGGLSSGAIVNYALLAMLVIGFALSMRNTSNSLQSNSST